MTLRDAVLVVVVALVAVVVAEPLEALGVMVAAFLGVLVYRGVPLVYAQVAGIEEGGSS